MGGRELRTTLGRREENTIFIHKTGRLPVVAEVLYLPSDNGLSRWLFFKDRANGEYV